MQAKQAYVTDPHIVKIYPQLFWSCNLLTVYKTVQLSRQKIQFETKLYTGRHKVTKS